MLVLIGSSHVHPESNFRRQPSSQPYCPPSSNLTPRCGPASCPSSPSVFYWVRAHCLHRPACSAAGTRFHSASHSGSQSISGRSGTSRSAPTGHLLANQCFIAPSHLEAEESSDSVRMTPCICAQKLEAALEETNATFESSSGSTACSSCCLPIFEEHQTARHVKIELDSGRALQQHSCLSYLIFSSSSRPSRSLRQPKILICMVQLSQLYLSTCSSPTTEPVRPSASVNS